MLDSKDLELLKAMMQEIVGESETRMTAKIESSIAESETRMTARIEARVDDTRSMLMAYLESAIEPKIRGVAEGYETLRDSKASNSRMERLENEVITLRSLLMTMSAKMSKLEKAQ